MIIPKRQVESYSDLCKPEVIAIHNMLVKMNKKIQDDDWTVTGFNTGVNSSADAGQSISHAHVYFMPRRKGDIANPQGGVRGVIPGKRHY